MRLMRIGYGSIQVSFRSSHLLLQRPHYSLLCFLVRFGLDSLLVRGHALLRQFYGSPAVNFRSRCNVALGLYQLRPR